MKKRYVIGGMVACAMLVTMLRGPLTARIEDVATLEEPELTPEEVQAYTQLSSKNSRAKEIFTDLGVFSELSHSLLKLFPEKQMVGGSSSEEVTDARELLGISENATADEIDAHYKKRIVQASEADKKKLEDAYHLLKQSVGIVIPIRAIMTHLVGSLKNVSELGLNIIKTQEQMDLIKTAYKCLWRTDKELKDAAQGILGDKEVELCTKAGYTTKKKVIASALLLTADATLGIFDNAFIKFNAETGKGEMGLFFNIDFVVDKIFDVLLQSTKFQQAINNLGATPLIRAYNTLGLGEGATSDEVEDTYDRLKAYYEKADHATRTAKLKELEDARSTVGADLMQKKVLEQKEATKDKPQQKAVSSSNLEKVKALRAQIGQVREIMKIAGVAFNGVLQAIVAYASAMEPSVIPPAKRKEYQQALSAALEIVIPDDDVLDTLVF